MTESNNIPKHWQVKKLGEVCEKITNGANAKQHDENIGFPISRIETIWNQKIDINRVKYIKENENQFVEKYSLRYNDILFSHINSDIHLGKTAVYKSVPKVLIHGINLLLIRTNSLIDPIYFNYYLIFLRARGKFISIAQKSVNQSSINQSKLKNVDVVFPPLPEQQAIVAKIEELFSELDNGIAQLKTAQQQLKVYRQSLLKWAFEGKLTNKNVKEGELPKGWKDVELKGIVERISDGPFGSNLKSIDYVNEGVRVIRLENIGEMEFRNEYKTFVTQEKYETIKRYTVGKGDIIFSSFISESIRSVILPDYIESAINKADCFLVRVSEATVSKKYLAYYFSTKAMQNQLVNQIHGATRPRINTTQLKASKIPFAPIKEQQLIVTELESKLTVCDKIEETICQSLQQAETLRQSILKKAFEGELVKMKP